MDYQKMWKDLKQKIMSDLEYHKSGKMQSIAESTHGELKCKEILALMNELEKDEN